MILFYHLISKRYQKVPSLFILWPKGFCHLLRPLYNVTKTPHCVPKKIVKFSRLLNILIDKKSCCMKWWRMMRAGEWGPGGNSLEFFWDETDEQGPYVVCPSIQLMLLNLSLKLQKNEPGSEQKIQTNVSFYLSSNGWMRTLGLIRLNLDSNGDFLSVFFQ